LGAVELAADGLPNSVGRLLDRDLYVAISVLHDDPAMAEDLHDDPAEFVLSALRSVHDSQEDAHPPDVFAGLAEGKPQPPLDLVAYYWIDC